MAAKKGWMKEGSLALPKAEKWEAMMAELWDWMWDS